MVTKKVEKVIRMVVLAMVLVALSAGDVVARTTAKTQFSVADNASDIIYRKNGKRNWWEENQTYSTRFRAEQLVAPVALVGIGALGIGKNSPMRGINLAIKDCLLSTIFVGLCHTTHKGMMPLTLFSSYV